MAGNLKGRQTLFPASTSVTKPRSQQTSFAQAEFCHTHTLLCRASRTCWKLNPPCWMPEHLVPDIASLCGGEYHTQKIQTTNSNQGAKLAVSSHTTHQAGSSAASCPKINSKTPEKFFFQNSSRKLEYCHKSR